jgi:hypothetical protein
MITGTQALKALAYYANALLAEQDTGLNRSARAKATVAKRGDLRYCPPGRNIVRVRGFTRTLFHN